MAIKVRIPTPMREHSGGKAEVEVAGGNVQECLNDVIRQYPGLTTKLFDNGKIRPYVNVFLNEEDIRYLDEMQSATKAGDNIDLIPAVAGG